MATMPRYPSLFQINTRVWLQRLSREAGRRITLADIDDATLDGFAEKGFNWIWLCAMAWNFLAYVALFGFLAQFIYRYFTLNRLAL